MVQQDQSKLAEDSVCQRVLALIDRTRERNEMAVGQIEELAEKWESLRNEVDGDLQKELDLMATEQQAASKARDSLGANRCVEVADAFVIAGRTIDEKDEVGLPGVRIEVATHSDSHLSVSETTSDDVGNFVFRFNVDDIALINEQKGLLSFRVLLDADTMVHQEQIDGVVAEKGTKRDVKLVVPCVHGVIDRALLGKSVRDSVLHTAELVDLKLENMREAHTAIRSMSNVLREEMLSLKSDLSTSQPTPTLPSGPAIDVPQPPATDSDASSTDSAEGRTSDASSEPRVTKLPPAEGPLGRIEGIDIIRGIELRNSGIKSLEDLSNADDDTLRRFFGKDEMRKVRKSAAAILKKEKKSPPNQSKR